MASSQWIDPVTELPELKDWGIKWISETVPLSKIDWDKSGENHARVIGKPIDPDHVEKITHSILDGRPIPKPILLKTGTTFLVWSGNHRSVGAKEAGKTEIEAIVVECTDEMACDLIPRILNRPGGMGQNKEEALLQAVHAIDFWKWTTERAAKAWALRPVDITTYLRSLKAAEQLSQ